MEPDGTIWVIFSGAKGMDRYNQLSGRLVPVVNDDAAGARSSE
jgi:hypothetical protein